MLALCVADVPAESVTPTTKLYVPAMVAVPLITPVEEFIDKPVGNVPEDTDHVYGDTPPDRVKPLL